MEIRKQINMKKLILIAIMLVGVFSLQAQKGAYKVQHYTDEFGDETENAFISKVFNGTFSNSATQGSKCKFGFQIGSDYVHLLIWEYGRNLVIPYKKTFYSVKFKNEKREVIQTKTYIYDQGSVMYFPTEYTSHYGDYKSSDWVHSGDIVEFLKRSTTIKMYITELGSYTTYSAKFSAIGFTKAYSKLK